MSNRRPLVRDDDLIADRYRLLRKLGQGGMGEVWAAHDELLRREVAIKVTRSDTNSAERLARLAREARAAAAVDSPFVARVLDANPEGHTPFIVMELLHGVSLSTELTTCGGSLPLEEAGRLIIQACIGVAHAHSAGVTHRDLKPSNLFLTEQEGEPRLKVVDFGIAKTTSPEDEPLTATGGSIGTPGYSAPEQLVSAKQTDRRVDVWALGMVAYQLLSGQRAFPAGDAVEYAAVILTEAPVPLESLVPGLPAEVGRAIHNCLRRDPNDRPWDVMRLAHAFAPHVEGGDELVARHEAATPGIKPLGPGSDPASPNDTSVSSTMGETATATAGDVMPANVAHSPQRLDSASLIAAPTGVSEAMTQVPLHSHRGGWVLASVVVMVLAVGLWRWQLDGPTETTSSPSEAIATVVASSAIDEVTVATIPEPSPPEQVDALPAPSATTPKPVRAAAPTHVEAAAVEAPVPTPESTPTTEPATPRRKLKGPWSNEL